MLPQTLYSYLIKVYVTRFCTVIGIASSVLLLANVIDMLSRFRAAKFTLALFINLVSFKIPYLLVEILPIISFITTIIFFEYLFRSNELVSIFNTGSSIWKVIMSILVSLILIGIFTSTVVQPFSSMLLASYDRLEAKILNKSSQSVVLSDQGIIIEEDYQNEKRFITTKDVDLEHNKISNVTIIFTDYNNKYLNRMHASYGVLVNSEIVLYDIEIFDNTKPKFLENTIVPTRLSIGTFLENLTQPEEISFWEFPEKIKKLKESGMPVMKYQLYYYKILLKSLSMVAFMLFAICASNANYERVRGIKKPFIAIVLGFAVYLCNEICVSIFIHNGLDPLLSILCPLCLIIFFSIFAILHLHELR